MSVNLPFEDSLFWNLNLYASMTPTHRRIADTFAVAFKAVKCGNQETCFWGRKKIAGLAKCSVSEVSRFLSKWGKFIFKDVKQRRIKVVDGMVKYFSNNYVFNERFFTLIVFLKIRRYNKHWKKHSCSLLTQASEDESLACKKMGYNFEVMNKQCAHDSRLKTHTRDLGIPSEYLDKVPRKQPTVPHQSQLREKASEIIKVPGLSNPCKAKLDRFGSMYLSMEINRDYEFNMKSGNRIRYPDRWVMSRMCSHMHQQFKILRSENEQRIL